MRPFTQFSGGATRLVLRALGLSELNRESEELVEEVGADAAPRVTVVADRAVGFSDTANSKCKLLFVRKGASI